MKCKLVLVFIVLLLFGFSTFSCFAQSSNNDQRIVGTWIWTSDDGNRNETFVFNANRSGIHTNPEQKSFSYGISVNGEIMIRGQNISDDSKIYFSPDGRTLIMFGMIWRKR